MSGRHCYGSHAFARMTDSLGFQDSEEGRKIYWVADIVLGFPLSRE